MKKIWFVLALVMLLAGCARNNALETVTDVIDAPVISKMQKILMQVPQELSSPVMQSENAGKLYVCDDYTVTVQIVESGDLEKTVRDATGMAKEELQILQTKQGDAKRYQWVWTANAETGIQVGRGCILDDGAYHYVLTALTDEYLTEKVRAYWNEMFASFRLTEEREEISIGS